MSNILSKSQKLRIFFRLIIVVLTWFVITVLKPETSTAFFQSLFIVSMTTFYEYAIMYLDSKILPRSALSVCGGVLSAIFLIYSLLGLFNVINFSTITLTFSLSNKVAFVDPGSITWSYYYIMPPVFIFPFLIFVEFFVKRTGSKTRKQRAEARAKNHSTRPTRREKAIDG